MARAYKILGQSQPASNTMTTLYTVPASTSAIISSVTVTNCDDPVGTRTANSFSIAVVPNGTTVDNSLANTRLIAYRVNCPVRDAITLTLGLTLATGDKLAVNANGATMTFSAFGTEIS